METVLKAIEAVETLVSQNTDDYNTASELEEFKSVDYTNTETTVDKLKTTEGDVRTAVDKLKTTGGDVKTTIDKLKTTGGDVRTHVDKLKTTEGDVRTAV